MSDVEDALTRYKNRGDDEITLQELLEICGVGPSHAHGLVGGGCCGRSAALFDFDPHAIAELVSAERFTELLDGYDPTQEEYEHWLDVTAERDLRGENGPQFDVWKIERGDEPSRFAISWRDDRGRALTYEGLFDTVEQAFAFVRQKYRRVEIWTDVGKHD